MIIILVKGTMSKIIALLWVANISLPPTDERKVCCVQCSALSCSEGQGHKYSLYVCIIADTHQLEVCTHCIETRIYNISSDGDNNKPSYIRHNNFRP